MAVLLAIFAHPDDETFQPGRILQAMDGIDFDLTAIMQKRRSE